MGLFWPLVMTVLFTIVSGSHSLGIGIMPSNSRSDSDTSASASLNPSASTAQPSHQGYTLHAFIELQVTHAPLIEKIIAIEKRLCGNICGSEYPSTSARRNDLVVCENCQCEANCDRYENCCPDVFLQRNITYKNEAECARLSPTDYILTGDRRGRDYNVGIYSSLITKCPADGLPSNDTTELIQRSKCEQPDVSNLDESLPVSDVSTNLSYANVYCAGCHDVRTVDIHEWSTEASCKKPGKLLNSLLTKEELYKTLSSEEGAESTECELTFYSDDQNKYRRSCRQPRRLYVSDCVRNYQSSRYYDEDVYKACHLYESLYYAYYKNIFCFMCYRPYNWTLSMLQESVDTFGTWAQSANMARLSFSALIDFKDDHRHERLYIEEGSSDLLVECSPSQVFDNATCSCRDIQCGEWRAFDPETRTCPGGIGSLGVGFQACLRVYVDFYTPPAVATIGRLSQEFESLEPTHKMKVTVSEWCPGDKRIVIHLESSAIEEDVEESGYAHEYYEKTFKKDGDIFCNFLEELKMKREVYGNNTLESCAFGMVDEIQCPTFYDFSLPCNHSDLGQVKQMDAINLTSFDPKDTDKQEIVFFSYVRTNHCAFVDISIAELNETDSALKHRLSLRSIARVQVQFQQNDTIVRVCLTDYLQWIKGADSHCENNKVNQYQLDISFDTWTIAGLISIISSCISLFFLLLTILTYLIFDELRTKGCVNLMVLTVILFIAQASYEFGMEQYENQILCSIFGAMIHYFWLASIFSMNACTIERFVKLYFPLESRSFFITDKPLVIATLYTFLCPLLIIACNIVANLVLTNEFGYGSPQICYINASNSRIFSFVMPMCVILVVNVVLLVVTITKLRKQTLPGNQKGSSSGSRIGLVACVRLSVVTGGTWLISLLYEAIPVEALGYVFTALLGSQGVVFFFSLLGNGRILGLYRGLVKSKFGKRTSTRSTTDERRKGRRKMTGSTCE